MKKTNSVFTAGTFLLFCAAAINAQGQILYSSDFAPDNGHDSTAYAPGWNPGAHWEWSSGEYPHVVWRNDPARAVGGSNGFFKEGLRDQAMVDAGGTHGEIGFTTEDFSINGLAGEAFTVSFDFKINSDPSVNNGESQGILQLRFRELDAEGANFPINEFHQNLFDKGNVIGNGIGPIEGFTMSVEQLDDDWLSISLTGAFTENTTFANVGFAPWSFGDPDNPDHFMGSYAVDNVTVVPEPSTYAMIAGLLALGGCFLRRRFKRPD